MLAFIGNSRLQPEVLQKLEECIKLGFLQLAVCRSLLIVKQCPQSVDHSGDEEGQIFNLQIFKRFKSAVIIDNYRQVCSMPRCC